MTGLLYINTYLLQFVEDLECFYNIYASMEKGYKDGKPPSALGPNHSCARILKHEEFCKMLHDNIQNIMRTHHIIVTGARATSLSSMMPLSAALTQVSHWIESLPYTVSNSKLHPAALE